MFFTLILVPSGPVGAGSGAITVSPPPESRAGGWERPDIFSLRKKAGPDWGKCLEQMALYQGSMAATGIIYQHAPEIRGIKPRLNWADPGFSVWWDHVSQAPVRDDADAWWVNYIGHPVMGAHMYMFAYLNGFGFWSSAAISTVGSVFWEYGPEGVFERPSLPDLLVTSTLGSLLGILYHRAYLKVEASPAGNKWYGKFLLWMLCPNYMLFD